MNLPREVSKYALWSAFLLAALWSEDRLIGAERLMAIIPESLSNLSVPFTVPFGVPSFALSF